MKSYYFEALIRLLYPAECEVCHSPLTLDQELLCAGCQQSLANLAWPWDKTCLKERFGHLDHIWTVFAYESPLREILRAVKYGRKEQLMKIFQPAVSTLAEAITSEYFYDAVIPIPIDRARYMERHFNQAETLVTLIAGRRDPPARKKLLIKTGRIPSQASLSREEREVNTYGIFKAGKPQNILGRSFLLADDVFTTGATANEAARTLKAAGAKQVDLFALARTIEPHGTPR